MIPKLQLILEYKHFFNEEPPQDRLELIRHIPKRNILFEIAGLNYRLKPFNQLKYDTTLKTQTDELRYFCPINNNLYDKYRAIFSQYIKDANHFALIFTRASNLFAIEEITNGSGFIENDNFQMRDVSVWNSIFKYLLAVNSETAKIKPVEDNNLTIENISASSLALNELMIEDNPFYTPYRGIKLIEFLSNHPLYGNEIDHYFNEVLKIQKDKFIFNLLALTIANKSKDDITAFVYKTNENDNFLEYLSDKKISNSNPTTLLSTKKTPFYKDSDNVYVVLDLNFLMSKSYYFFINDFWFDYLKPQKNPDNTEKFSFKNYRGAFGLFFESYVQEILLNSFNYLKYPRPLLFDDLKMNTRSGQIEIADIYVRQNKKVLVGQVKSSSIYDKEKYSGEIDKLYRQDREQFFIDFGVNQTLQSIKDILIHYESFDAKLPVDKRLTFFPTIVVNEKLFQTPMLSNLLHRRFQELMSEEDFGKHKINPLVVIHISDIEYLNNSLASKKIKIWDLLDKHIKKIENTLMPPFIVTSDNYINPGSISERALESIKVIVRKYSNEKE